MTGTYDDYKTAFLQRLANPLWPWNPETGHSRHDPRFPVNPYVTVDFIPINLTVFNGEDVKPAVWPPAGAEALGDLPFDPSEGEDGEPDWGNVRFGISSSISTKSTYLEYSVRITAGDDNAKCK